MAATKRKTTTTRAKKGATKASRKSTGQVKVKVKKTKATSTTRKSTKTSKPTRASKKTTTKARSSKVTKAMTRAQQIGKISEDTTLAKKEVNQVIDTMETLISSHLKGPGEISLAGLMKIVIVRKPATKARKGINPFTGEEMMFKAKPARNVVKIRPLKKLKDMVA